jgi:hypothetical protein
MRSLKAQEPLFQKYADLLKCKVLELGQDGKKPINIGELLNFTICRALFSEELVNRRLQGGQRSLTCGTSFLMTRAKV